MAMTSAQRLEVTRAALVSVARHAGLPGAGRLGIARDTDRARYWYVFAYGDGMGHRPIGNSYRTVPEVLAAADGIIAAMHDGARFPSFGLDTEPCPGSPLAEFLARGDAGKGGE